MNGMKAWKVYNTYEVDESGMTVVFAETRGKAHLIAMRTECCEGAEWNDVRVVRCSEMDKRYHGFSEMEWDDPEDRIVLVKECGWHCQPDWLDMEDDCKRCPAAEWCDYYKDWLAENEKEE